MEQVIFKMDKKLKALTMKKAKREGVTLSSLFKSAAKAFVRDEFEVGFTYSPKLLQAIRQSEKDVKAGRVYRGDLDELVKRFK